MALLKDILWTIGGPEAPVGTLVARTKVLPVTDHPGFTQRITRVPDPVIAGARMKARSYPVKKDVAGPFPLSPRVGGGWGMPLKSLFGTESAPAQIGAVIKVRYTGASASCKLIADTAANTLVSKVGVLGAEANDAGFGVAGSIDLTAVPTDTVTEIVALIEGYADYECRLVTGDGAVISADIVTLTTQAKGKWTYLFFTRATGGAYLRTFTSDLTSTEHGVYSVEGEGYTDNLSYTAVQFTNMKLSAAKAAMVTATMDAIGFVEAPGAGASGLTIANLDPGLPLIFGDGTTCLAAHDYPEISSLDLAIDDGHNKETFGQGSLGRIYQQKGELVITGTLQLQLNASSYLLRANLGLNTLVGLTFTFKGGLIGGLMYEMIIAEIPYCQIMDPYDFVNDGGAFAAKVNVEAYNPQGTKWDVPIKFHMISADAAAF